MKNYKSFNEYPKFAELQNTFYYQSERSRVGLVACGELTGTYEIINLNNDNPYVIARCVDTKIGYIISRASIK
jgi:hypothetical protein